MNLSQNSLFKADTYVRSVAEAEFWDRFIFSDNLNEEESYDR